MNVTTCAGTRLKVAMQCAQDILSLPARARHEREGPSWDSSRGSAFLSVFRKVREFSFVPMSNERDYRTQGVLRRTYKIRAGTVFFFFNFFLEIEDRELRE